jgi:hypothetical protein
MEAHHSSRQTMRKRIYRSIPLAVLGLLLAAATAYAVVWVPIYGNDMSTNGLRSQMVQVGKGKCAPSGVSGTFRVKIGKKTLQCVYRTPVIGRDLSNIVTGKLLSGTPSSFAKRTFISVSLRNGDSGQFQLQVFPAKGTFKLVRDTPPNGKETVVAVHKSSAVKGLNLANKLRLDANNTTDTSCRVTAYDNGKKLAAFTDPACNQLSGRLSTFSVGSAKAANGALASFDNLQVSVPDPNG